MTAITVVINQKHRDIIPTLNDKCQWWSFTCNTKCSPRDHRLNVPSEGQRNQGKVPCLGTQVVTTTPSPNYPLPPAGWATFIKDGF